MFLKSGFTFKGLYPGANYSQLTRLTWFAGGLLLAQKMRLEARAKVRATSRVVTKHFLPLLSTGCGQHEQEGGEQVAALCRGGGLWGPWSGGTSCGSGSSR